MLGSAKDDLGLRSAGVYCIPYQCGLCCIGQTGHMDLDRCKEHTCCTRLNYPDTSALEQYSTETGNICFESTSILYKSTRYWNRLYRETIYICLEEWALNTDLGLLLSSSRKPAFMLIR